MAIKLRALVKHPSQVEGDTGIVVTKENGVLTVALDLGSFSETASVADTDATTVLLVTPGATDDLPDVVERMSIDDFYSGAPTASAQYLVAAASSSLTAERVATDTATVAWDFATAAQAKANVPDNAVTFAKMQNIATNSLVGRDTAATGEPENILLNATLEMDGAGNLQRAALTGDVTVTAGSNATTVAADAVTFAKMQNIATDSLIGRDTAGTGDPENITLNATLSMTGAGVLQRAALTGDVTASAGSNATTVANDAVTFVKMQNIATDSLIGRDTASSGDPENILLNATLGMDGSGNLQRAALTGDVTASAGSNATTIPNNTVTYAKMQDVSATSRLLGRKTAGSGDPEELTFSEALDFVGSAAQGDILYRNATAWVRLGAGTSGDFLKTNGAGANPAWATASGSATAASQAEQEAASSTTVFVTPGRQQFHPSAAKAWAYVNASGTLLAGEGVSSTSRTTTGTYVVNFSTSFSSVSYAAVPGSVASAQSSYATAISLATGSVGVNMRNTVGQALTDADFSIVCFGDR